MPGRRMVLRITLMYFILVSYMYFMLFYIKKYGGGTNTYMEQQITNTGQLIAAITTLAGILTVFITQIFFYRKDSQTMSEIKQLLENGSEKLNDRMSANKKELSGEHSNIRDVVKEIQLKQEQELELQKAIRDTVPDAGMIKDGIDKICRENATLREEISSLKLEVERLQAKNKELPKSNKRLMQQIEHALE